MSPTRGPSRGSPGGRRPDTFRGLCVLASSCSLKCKTMIIICGNDYGDNRCNDDHDDDDGDDYDDDDGDDYDHDARVTTPPLTPNRGILANMLLTSCKDAICRIWCETFLPDDGLFDSRQANETLHSGFAFGQPGSRRNSHHHNHKHRLVQRLAHIRLSTSC